MTNKTCPDCGRQKASHLAWINDFDSKCAAWTGATDARLACNVNTIARLRAELASARELDAAERAVVEAATTLHHYWNNVEALNYNGLKFKSEETTRLSGELEARTLELIVLRAKKAGT